MLLVLLQTLRLCVMGTSITGFSAILLYLYYAYYAYIQWERDFARKRVSRSCKTSPSHKHPPNVVPWEENKNKTLRSAATHRKSFGQCELVQNLHGATNPEETGKNAGFNIIQERAACTESFEMIETRRVRASFSSSVTSFSNSSGSADESSSSFLSPPSEVLAAGWDIESVPEETSKNKEEEKDKVLDMDHIYIPFLSFLWAKTFITPFTTLWAMKGILILKIRDVLHNWGIIDPKPCNYAEVVGRLCMEGAMAMHYYAKSNDGKTAGFIFADFPIFERDGTVHICDLFVVDVDLKTKTMVKARLDDTYLTASEALILVAFNLSFLNHVRMHSLSNWGVNVEEEQWENDSFVAQNGLATIIYNYLGYSVFYSLMPIWVRMGLMEADYSNSLVACVNIGIRSGIWSHPQIRDLMKYSKLVNFLVKARSIFMSEFQKHKSHFPGIHGEALFVGTIIHSLDHFTAERYFKDPLWLDVDHPRFGPMAGISRIARAGFVEELPLLYFHRKFNGSNHPFFEAVYAKCVKLDNTFANNMDTCVIK